MSRWKPTHVSRWDGSPARITKASCPMFFLENEEGFVFPATSHDWVPIDEYVPWVDPNWIPDNETIDFFDKEIVSIDEEIQAAKSTETQYSDLAFILNGHRSRVVRMRNDWMKLKGFL